MSAIVVVRKNGRVAMAADTQSSDDSVAIPAEYMKNHDKIVQYRDAFLGFAGWSASQEVMESVIRNHSDKLDFSSRHAVFETARRVHSVLKSDYFLDTQEDKDQPVESSQISMLVAGPNGIFELESYRAVVEYTRFWAIGSGRSLALGAMHAVYDLFDDPVAIASAGVAAACEFDDGCDLPISVRTAKLAPASAAATD